MKFRFSPGRRAIMDLGHKSYTFGYRKDLQALSHSTIRPSCCPLKHTYWCSNSLDLFKSSFSIYMIYFISYLFLLAYNIPENNLNSNKALSSKGCRNINHCITPIEVKTSKLEHKRNYFIWGIFKQEHF
jgi:hypothetical protein